MLLIRTGRFALAILAFVAVLYFGQSVVPQEKKPAPAETLSGSWRADVSDTQALLLDIKGETVEMNFDVSGAVTRGWTARLVLPKEHSDRHMDWIDVRAGNQALPDNKCLYRLSGSTLLVIGGGIKERPARFYSGPGGEPRTLIFTRLKPAGE